MAVDLEGMLGTTKDAVLLEGTVDWSGGAVRRPVGDGKPIDHAISEPAIGMRARP